MGELYLSSRTEVLRSMNIDTGRKVAIIGAPEDFIVWMNKILPIHNCIAGTPDDMEAERNLDIILWWTPKGAGREGIDNLIEHLSASGDLWIIVERGIQMEDSGYVQHSDRERTLMITPTLDLVPVLIRSSSQ